MKKPQSILSGLALLIAINWLPESRAFANEPLATLTNVVHRLTAAFAGEEPKVRVEYNPECGSARLQYRAQKFWIHQASKLGEWSTNALEEIGPSAKGLVLNVRVEPLGQINQLATPQTLRGPYFSTWVEITPIAKTTNQACWFLSVGQQTDPKLIQNIKQALQDLKVEATSREFQR